MKTTNLKTREVKIMNKKIMRAMGLNEEVDLVDAGKCPFCKKTVKVSDFQDTLSFREFEISGLCSECQDEMFGSAGSE
jgi:hypothetical protein